MKLSAKQFLQKFDNNELGIAFVGMSNIGKSFTARRLSKAFKFDLVEIDKMIWERLGHDDMEEFADWMGHPYEEGYSEREQATIEFENVATQKAIDGAKGNTLLDTTGSVVYTTPTLRRHIKEKYYVVHIKAEPSDLDRLTWDYFDNPKPLIWGRQYRPKPGLTDRENVHACYPKLLMSRAKDYAAMADQTLTSRFVLDPDTTDEDLFLALKPSR